jgi:hypothetical protein
MSTINMPGFAAAASLYGPSGYYCTGKTTTPFNGVVAAFPWDPPIINVTYQPPRPPFGRGFPGMLTVTGQNFNSDADVQLTINNCTVNPYRLFVHTSKTLESCRHPWDCTLYLGGSFSMTVPCYCGGAAGVEAIDQSGNKANGTTGLPC